MKKSDFFYELPEELIAQTPSPERDGSSLMVLDKCTGEYRFGVFHDIVDELREGDLLVMNDSRVLPARLIGTRPGGGAAEILLLRERDGGLWECLVRPGRRLRVGARVSFGEEMSAEIVEVLADGN